MNDYNEVRAHLAHFGITGQKKGLRRFQSYAVAPTRSGMVGQETGEAAKQRGRLGKKVKDTAKKAAKDLKNRYKHGITANKFNDSRKVAGAAAKVSSKLAKGLNEIEKSASTVYDKNRTSEKFSLKDAPAYVVQEGKKYYDKNKPKTSNNFRPFNQNALISNAKTLKKPAKAVAKGVGIVANETAHTIQDVSKFAPPSVKAARANPKDSFIIKGYQRGQKHRRKKK